MHMHSCFSRGTVHCDITMLQCNIPDVPYYCKGVMHPNLRINEKKNKFPFFYISVVKANRNPSTFISI